MNGWQWGGLGIRDGRWDGWGLGAVGVWADGRNGGWVRGRAEVALGANEWRAGGLGLRAAGEVVNLWAGGVARHWGLCWADGATGW